VAEEPLVINPDAGEGIAFLLSCTIAAWYLKTKHWCANNVFGVCFSMSAIEQISLGSYKVGALLLVGLFFYDIFWVFGTDVMVTVAKSFDAPIKLLFLREFATSDTAAQFSMLGLGDIVMPGVFLSLLLRFDFRRSRPDFRPCTDVQIRGSAPFVKTYFNVTIVAYTLGLVTTVLVMYKWGAAQPALLYLVPACLGASLLTALLRGELGALLAFEDTKIVVPAEQEKEKEKTAN
jgi:minor histocompatibility antigen H13